MTVHLYFSLIPEALIASELPPEEFGPYYSHGHGYKSRGEALFFEIDPSYRHPYFDIDGALARCVSHPDHSPKNSVYISTYRVLEHLPTSTIGSLYLSTRYGATLGLDRAAGLPESSAGLHLVQELAPVNSLVVTSLASRAFYESVTVAPSKLVRFPALCFVSLKLGALADDPINGEVGDLPYSYIHHLREALFDVQSHPKKLSKMVQRVHSPEFPFRMVRNGFYVGNGHELAFYRMPSVDELRSEHPLWWRSANA